MSENIDLIPFKISMPTDKFQKKFLEYISDGTIFIPNGEKEGFIMVPSNNKELKDELMKKLNKYAVFENSTHETNPKKVSLNEYLKTKSNNLASELILEYMF